MNIFSFEFLVLFLIVAAAGYKALKTLRNGGRKEGPPEEDNAVKTTKE